MYVIFVAGFLQRHELQRDPPGVREECPNLKRISIPVKFPILTCALKVVVLHVSLHSFYYMCPYRLLCMRPPPYPCMCHSCNTGVGMCVLLPIHVCPHTYSYLPILISTTICMSSWLKNQSYYTKVETYNGSWLNYYTQVETYNGSWLHAVVFGVRCPPNAVTYIYIYELV
jgi:hypothetical protein